MKLPVGLFLLFALNAHVEEASISNSDLIRQAVALGVTPVTQEQRDKLFGLILQKNDIPYGYVKDVCYARACPTTFFRKQVLSRERFSWKEGFRERTPTVEPEFPTGFIMSRPFFLSKERRVER